MSDKKEKIKLAQLANQEKDKKFLEFEQKHQWVNEIDNDEKKLERLQVLQQEVKQRMEKLQNEWKLFFPATDSGKIYDFHGNEITDFEEFREGVTDEHYKIYYKHFTNYLILRQELNEELKKLKFKVGEIEEKSANKEEVDLVKIFPNIKARHQFLLLYELGIIDHLKKELAERGIDESKQNDSYIARLLAYVMNTELSVETLRKDRSYLTHPKPPIKSNPKNKRAMQKVKSILEKFNLNIRRL